MAIGMPEAAQEEVSLARFIRQLWETGQVDVADAGKDLRFVDDRDDAWLQLQWCASEERLSLPGHAPTLSRPSAEWALHQFYRACSFLVHRSHAETELRHSLNVPAPESPSPAVCYSIDLVFRFLSDLHRLAQSISPNDPLLNIVETWGRDWPLSSVGMAFAAPKESAEDSGESGELPPQTMSPASEDETGLRFDLLPWWDDDCLRRLYVDRVLRRSDRSRLSDPRVATAVRSALGNYPELAPDISAAMTCGGETTQ
jgi:hypothetical protein